MSSKVEDPEKVIPVALKINDQDDRSSERSRSSVPKSVVVNHDANGDSQAKRNSLDEANGVKYNRNSTFRSASVDLPIENRGYDGSERSRSSVQKIISGNIVANGDSQAKHDGNSFRSTSSNLPIENLDHDYSERSGSSIQKSVAVNHIANRDSQAKRNSLDEANGVKYDRNSTFRSMSSDPPIESREHHAGERSRSSVQKSFTVDHVAKENSQSRRNSVNEANAVKLNNIVNHIRNSTLRTASSDPPIEDREIDAGFAEERHDEMQQLLGLSGSDDRKSNENKKSTDCTDECICKIKQALGLIVEEIKKVDTAIKDLSANSQCPYVPKPDDKKEFAKSVQKNSSVCHVIIGELKKQRIEIDEMLQLYEESTRDFSKMEATLSRQREKIEQMDAALVSVADTLSNAREDIEKRKENFQLDMKSRRGRAETREEILRVFLNWISSLEAKRYEERVASELRLKEAIEERDRDRAMLTLAVGQLREVRRIEILLMTQRAAMTRGTEDTSNGPILASSCGCSSPIGQVAVVSGQCLPEPRGCGALRGKPGPVFNNTLTRCATGTHREMVPASFCGFSSPIDGVAVVSGQCPPGPRGCGTSRRKPGPVFNHTATRCAGGADGFGTAMTFGTGLKDNKNGVWNSRTPLGYQNIVRGPRTYHRRVPIGRRKSPTNNSRRHGKKIKNMQKTTPVRHCI